LYQALYRKYRPRTFDQVAGQEHITETLKNQVQSGRLSHAYLFIGTRGTGKTTCAKILAKAVNCERPVNGNPCNECAACRGIDDGSVMDVVEIDAASNNSVDNVRALRDEAVFSPASVKKRVYIIDEVHMLSTAAFNALLKILEEPPEHLMFILATTELRKVPATILSRCQRYSFRRITVPVLSERLNWIAGQEGLDLKSDASSLLARLADGSFRDGISLLDQCSGAQVINTDTVLSAMGLAGNRRVAEVLAAIAGRDAQTALTLFSSLWQDGKDPAGLLSDLCVLMRDILMLSVAPHGGGELLSGGYDRETLKSFSGSFTKAELLRNMERVQESLSAMRDNPSPRTAAELCLVALCDERLTDGLPELRARLSRLEENGAAAPKTPVIPAEPAQAKPAERTEKPAETPKQRKPAPVPAQAAPVTSEEAPRRASAEPIPQAPETPAAVPAPQEAAKPAPADTPPWDDEPPPPDDRDEPKRAVSDEPPLDDESCGCGNDEDEDAPTSLVSWAAIAAAVRPSLPVALRALLGDPLQIIGVAEGDVLQLSIASGFASTMLNKPDILALFTAAAGKLSGRDMKTQVSQMDSAEKIEKRSLDELAKFKGVTIK
jgi:DNA polymerase-3 subunit gamma/tau